MHMYLHTHDAHAPCTRMVNHTPGTMLIAHMHDADPQHRINKNHHIKDEFYVNNSSIVIIRDMQTLFFFVEFRTGLAI